MFYDERINSECGRIYQRGILYAVIVTLLYGIGHGVYLYGEVGGLRLLPYLLTELSIVICGSIILLMGLLQYGGDSDERLLFEKHRYYLRSSLIFLVVALSGYAISIPIHTGKNFQDIPLNELPIILEVLGVIYLFYSFKKKDICFNYSFIDKEGRDYYRHVFGNIGKFAAVVFLGYFFAAMLDYGLHGSFLSFLAILVAYLVSVVELGLWYLLISFVEKVNYEKEDNDGVKLGTVVTALILFGFMAVGAVLRVWSVFFTTGNLQSYPIPAGTVIANLQNMIRYVGYITTMLSAIAMTHFYTQVRASRRARRTISAMLLVMALSVILYYVKSFVMSCAKSESLVKLLAETGVFQNMLFFIAYLVILCFFVRALIVDFGVTKLLISLPVLYLVQGLIDLVAVSTDFYRLGTILQQILLIGTWVLGLCLLQRFDFGKEEELKKTDTCSIIDP